jgi:hypothetical protein
MQHNNFGATSPLLDLRETLLPLESRKAKKSLEILLH